MPFVIPILAVLGVGGLVFKTVTDEVEDTVNSTAPNLVMLAGVAIAGYAVWSLARSK